LHAEWDRLDGPHKAKWLEVAGKFSSMKADEQARVTQRMREWAALTPDQRRKARDNYLAVKALPKGERQARWEHYQALPDEKKQAIASKAAKAETKPGALPQAAATKGGMKNPPAPTSLPDAEPTTGPAGSPSLSPAAKP
jgi:hypothetical protein